MPAKQHVTTKRELVAALADVLDDAVIYVNTADGENSDLRAVKVFSDGKSMCVVLSDRVGEMSENCRLTIAKGWPRTM